MILVDVKIVGDSDGMTVGAGTIEIRKEGEDRVAKITAIADGDFFEKTIRIPAPGARSSLELVHEALSRYFEAKAAKGAKK